MKASILDLIIVTQIEFQHSLNNIAFMYQTWNNLGISVVDNLENGLSANFPFSSKKCRGCGLCQSQCSGSY